MAHSFGEVRVPSSERGLFREAHRVPLAVGCHHVQHLLYQFKIIRLLVTPQRLCYHVNLDQYFQL